MTNKVSLIAPISGNVVSIEEVDDPVFSEKMMGDGLAIEPTDGVVLAPCDGKIIHVFPTKHALGILTKEGIEILIHIGLDTVNLNGKGFKSYVKADEEIKQGQKLLSFKLDFITKKAKSSITPIVITNMDKVNNINIKKGSVEAGKDVIMEIEIHEGETND